MSLDVEEINARATKCRALIAALREHGELSQDGMTQAGGRRYGGRLAELRTAGWVIDTLCLGRGVFRYRLVAEPGASLPLVDLAEAA